MKSASNYVITFLKWALISIIIGVVGGCVGAVFHMSVNYANIIFTMHDWFVLFLPIGGIIIVAMYKACKMLENKGTDSVISSIRNDEKYLFTCTAYICKYGYNSSLRRQCRQRRCGASAWRKYRKQYRQTF